MPNTLTNLSETAKQYYDKTLLIRAEQAQVVYQLGQKRNVPKNSGNQISFRRVNTLALNTTPLTEGVTPTESQLTMTEITGTMQQYGAYVTLTDFLDMAGIDPIVDEAIEVLSQNAGESVERIIYNELVTGTNVIYGTGTLRNQQSGANPLTLRLLRRAIRTLDRNNARRFTAGPENSRPYTGNFVLIVHPDTYLDLMNDTEVVTTMTNNSNNKVIFNGEMTQVLNVKILQSSLAPVFTGSGAGGADVYRSLMFAVEAFGVVDLAGTGKFDSIVKPLGSAGASDPMNQRSSVAWKSYQLPRILNNNFMVGIETGASS